MKATAGLIMKASREWLGNKNVSVTVNSAPEEIPNRYGSPRGFLVHTCISKPEIDSNPPTKKAAIILKSLKRYIPAEERSPLSTTSIGLSMMVPSAR